MLEPKEAYAASRDASHHFGWLVNRRFHPRIGNDLRSFLERQALTPAGASDPVRRLRSLAAAVATE